MRTFEGLNIERGDKCFICGTQKKGEVVLISLVGTQDGNICEAIQAHLECLNPWYDREHGIIYQRVEIDRS